MMGTDTSQAHRQADAEHDAATELVVATGTCRGQAARPKAADIAGVAGSIHPP